MNQENHNQTLHLRMLVEEYNSFMSGSLQSKIDVILAFCKSEIGICDRLTGVERNLTRHSLTSCTSEVHQKLQLFYFIGSTSSTT